MQIDSPPVAAPDAIAPVGRFAVLVFIFVPFLGLMAAMLGAWGWGLRWPELSVFLVMYIATGFGITVGFHRLFTHRSFETNAVCRFLLGVLGSMSAEGSLFSWVAVHRRHHQHSDEADDPHSPHAYGGGVWGVARGFWHAHAGWLLAPHPKGLDRYVTDLKRDRALRVVNDYFVLWLIAGLVLPAAVCGILTGSWTGVLLGFLWGGLARIFMVHHLTWSINSICHLWGSRDFHADDESRNSAVCGVLAFGEGWHNNHHAFPTSVRHGLKWWQFDASYIFVRVMRTLGLAWQLRLPSAEAMAAKRIQPERVKRAARVAAASGRDLRRRRKVKQAALAGRRPAAAASA